VAARLAEHAWIEEARALALPSGRLLLAVLEREPVAVLAGEEPWAVDAAGSPFAPAPSVGLEALPRLVAAHAAAPRDLAQAVALARRLPELGLAAPLEVGIAAPNDPEGLSLRLPGLAPRVVLGREDLDAKLADLTRVLEAKLPELAGATRLDLRFRDQAVLDVTPPPKGTAQAAASRGRAMPSDGRPTG
jgi:cell division septal protein FtsQ